MNFANAQYISRLGLAFVFIYAAVASFLSPDEWASYLPSFISYVMPISVALWLHAIVELLIGLALIFHFMPRITYALATMMLGAILVFLGINDVTFRDVGLVAMALSLWISSYPKKVLS